MAQFKGKVMRWYDTDNIVVQLDDNSLFSSNLRMLRGDDAEKFLSEQGLSLDKLSPYKGNVSATTASYSELKSLEEKQAESLRMIAQQETDTKAMNESNAKAAANQTTGFRPRGANESMEDYLVAKNIANPGSVDFGTPDNKPMQNTVNQAGGTVNMAGSTEPIKGSQGQSQQGYVYGEQFLGSKANNAAVNQLYNSYFGRDATQAELDNWGERGGQGTTVKALEDFLKNERIKYGVTTPVVGIGENQSNTTTDIPKTGNPELDALLARMDKYFQDQLALGKKVNPSLELDPTTIQKFLDQATSEIEPYYANQINVFRKDLEANLDSLQQQYEYQKKTSEETFKKNLGTSRESAAQSGMVFSGGRGRTEQDAVTSTQRTLDYNANQLQSQIGSSLRKAEQTIGGRNLQDLGFNFTTPSSVSLEGRGGYTGSRSLELYQPASSTVGSLEYQKRSDILNRQYNLEELERRRRLNQGTY